jgi:hypothetical protein
VWVSAVTVVTGAYPWTSALLVNHLLGPAGWSEPAWHYWFVEVAVWSLLGLAALISVPLVHRLDLRHPFALPVALALLGLLTRYDLLALRGGDEIHRPEVVWWLLAIGWAAARATTVGHRALLTGLVLLSVPGFFGDPAREAVVVLGVLVLVWLRRVRLPAPCVPLLGVLAASSLWVYLTHWQVYPHLEVDHPLLATVASFAVGVVAWRAWGCLGALLAAVRSSFTGRPVTLSRPSPRPQ